MRIVRNLRILNANFYKPRDVKLVLQLEKRSIKRSAI